ncbi:aspartate/glutamate racemase family protein [Algirhabdus cladophorae]|uniref:aspartate/glutamate racemase family protein n=1 Tax=Algirhabdus cladophorae TaxID=3377108 RepID=UPI003B846F7D
MIVLINPNSTETMTKAMLQTAQAAAPHARFEGWTSHDGPASIQGEADGIAATPALLKLVGQASDQGASAIIIGCFDDTALSQAREIAACPVIGIGQAAYHMAALYGPKFSVVTTLPISVPVLKTNIDNYGLSGHLGKVRASDVPVLAIETDPDASATKIIAEIRAANDEDAVQSIVLGCGGMVDIERKAAPVVQTKLIDGVTAAALFASTF